jgi:GNAT superfamily N-acetyltransferase
MEPVVVRPARPGDAADLARNWIDVARHYAELDADAFTVPAGEGLAGWFEELLRRPRRDGAVWLVAEVDGQVVGDVAAHLERPAEDAARQLLRNLGRVRLYVDALGVREAYRRRGVGARLMHVVEQWGRDHGADRAVLTEPEPQAHGFTVGKAPPGESPDCRTWLGRWWLCATTRPTRRCTRRSTT